MLRNHENKTNEARVAQAKVAEEKKASGTAEKFTFVLKHPCPVCDHHTRVVKCKSCLLAEPTDLDLCIHYKDFNPYLYRVWVCERCGYAADEQKFIQHMPENPREKLLQFMQTADIALPFVEEHSSEQAIQYVEMAFLFNELTDPSRHFLSD